MEFFRCVEVQERGALHDHLLMVATTTVDVDRVRELAMRCGFGHAVDVKVIGNRKAGAAHYAAKYVSKACDVRSEVPWAGDVMNLETGEITRGAVHARYRTWSSSRSWGLTMKLLRARQRECVLQHQEQLHDAALAVAVLIADQGLVKEPAICGPAPPT
jgi:hypothetical protein